MGNIEEIKETFEAHHEKVGRVLTQVVGRLDALEKGKGDEVKEVKQQLEHLQAVIQRPGAGGGGGGLPSQNAVGETKAMRAFVRDGNDAEIKTMSVGSDPDGGYVVLPVFSAGMTKKLFDQSPMRRLCRVETITTGDSFEEPIDNDDVGASWVGEAAARPATDTAQLGLLRVQVHETYALQTVTQRLIDDASVDIAAWVEGKVTDKFGRQEGEAFFTGDGVAKPMGFLSYPTSAAADATRAWGTLQYFTSGNATAITADELRTMVWGLRAPYRAGAAWLMNSNTAGAIDKLKNGQGDYIWRDSSAAGVPPTLLGYPVEIDENMPDIAAGTFPIAFGNWKQGYLAVDKKGIRFLRDPYTSKPNVLVYAYRRVGGGVANSEAIKLMKIAA
jgi:HK97 family phage major capsid protein